MKATLLLGVLFTSLSASGGEFYSVKTLWGGQSASFAIGDVVYCSGLDAERKIGLGCVNLNVMQEYSVTTDSDSKIVVTSRESGDSLIVGQIDTQAGQYILDELTSGYMNKVSLQGATDKLEANILVRSKLSLNDKIGCQGVFDCDWRLLYAAKKVSLEVKLNNKRLEKVRLN